MHRLASLASSFVFGLSLTVTVAAAAHAQPRAHVDTVLVARDLDGDGITDYIVRESKASLDGAPRARRLAIYLGVEPAAARAAWATDWDDEYGGSTVVSELLPLGTSSTIIAVSESQADYESTHVVLIRARRAKMLVSHGIDYGEGYFQLRLEGGRAVVDATQEHLELSGKAIDGTLACADAQRPALRLVFDPRTERFVPDHPRCVRVGSGNLD